MEIKGFNEREHLILILNEKQKKYIDRTKNIFYLSEQDNCYRIGFKDNNGSSNYYNVAKYKVFVSITPKEIEYDKDNVYINGKKVYAYNIIQFGKIGYKVFLNEYKTEFFFKMLIGEKGKIEFFNQELVMYRTDNKVFNYFKSLANYASGVSDDTDNLSVESLLFNLYCSIEKVNDRSVLYAYSNKINKAISFKDNDYIYPFQTNLSQIKAIKNGFTNQMSIISGPPGTGKTQVILNLICNAIVNNMKVAIISNNNTAVQNVYDKMKEEGLDFLLAFLGNRDNVNNFFDKEDNLEDEIQKLKYIDKNCDINELVSQLSILLERKNDLIKLKHDLFELEEEYRHYIGIHSDDNLAKSLNKLSTRKLSKMKIGLLYKKKYGSFIKRKYQKRYGIDISNSDELNSIFTYIDKIILEEKIKNIKFIIDVNENYIKDNNLDVLNQSLLSSSKNRLYKFIIEKYKNYKKVEFDKDNYRVLYNAFLDRYPVVLSTTHSLLRNTSFDSMFDLVIIDEASQSDIMTTLLPMSIAKRMIVVGDSKQLPQIDNQSIYSASDYLADNYNIEEYYRYRNNSILTSMIALPCNVTNTILREHYRCDSRIIEFCNKKFYDNQLIVYTETSEEDPLFVIHTVEGNHARKNPNGTGQYNDREAQEILEIIKNSKSKDIGIITPFRAQAEYINKLVKEDYPYVEVDTIHKYQGRQKEVIILSTVVNDIKTEEFDFVSDFVTNSKLMNVAISRAVKELYLVVSNNVYNSKNNSISEFIDYIRYYCKNESIQNGKVISIFDKLYKDNTEEIMNSKCKKYVDSYAEEIMIKLLDEELKNYHNYNYCMHYRLSELISKYDGFTKEEIKYIKHPKTHVDFVIFNNINYKPIVCVEVDGTRYHDYDKRQIDHDNIKDRILIHNDIPILRLKTNQSGEIEKLRKYLK